MNLDKLLEEKCLYLDDGSLVVLGDLYDAREYLLKPILKDKEQLMDYYWLIPLFSAVSDKLLNSVCECPELLGDLIHATTIEDHGWTLTKPQEIASLAGFENAREITVTSGEDSVIATIFEE